MCVLRDSETVCVLRVSETVCVLRDSETVCVLRVSETVLAVSTTAHLTKYTQMKYTAIECTYICSALGR